MNNRELKFRIWDKKSVCWVSDYENAVNQNRLKFFIDLTGKIGKIIYPLYEGDGSEDNVVNPENYVIQQYTGLKDKHGKEIYEGDIVEWKDENLIGKIYWSIEDTAFIFRSSKGSSAFINEVYMNNFKIIGNIFENEDLLQ